MSLLRSTTSECRVYVGNLPQYVKNRELEEFFDKYGTIKGVDIHNRFDPAFAFIEFEDPRDAEDAVKARDNEKFYGQRIKVQFPRNSNSAGGGGGGGERGGSSSYRGGGGAGRDRDRDFSGPGRSGGGGVSGSGGYTRGRGRGLPIRRSEYRVLVSGLPATGSWQDLKDHMREAGEVLYADVYKDGTAVCEFATRDDMNWACKYLDDSKFKSHENESTYIRVKRSKSTSKSRSPSPRGRSRSRSRSRTPPRRRSRSSSGSSSPRRR